MKHLRKFEEYEEDFGYRFSEEPTSQACPECGSPECRCVPEEDDKIEYLGIVDSPEDSEECMPCGPEDKDEDEETKHNWGDENLYVESVVSFKNFINEKKATPAQLAARKAFAEKAKEKAGKKDDKKDVKSKKDDKSKKEVSYKKSGLKNPEKADLDKNKKISGWEKARGKAVQDAIEDEKEEKGGKGLTAAQKKLPEGLRKAIETKNKKK